MRTVHEERWLITQPDHAGLAARILEAWQCDGFPSSETRAVVLFAAREHDNGWQEEDRVPIVDDGSGEVLDFIHAPDTVRQRIWRRAVDRLSDTPYAAALVAHHAVSIFDRYRRMPAWQRWFSLMEAARDAALQRAKPLTRDDLRRDYFFIAVADLASLTFCNGWTEPQHAGPYEIRLGGSMLRITPDPFAGREVPLAIGARKLANGRFASAAAAAAAFDSATRIIVRGTAAGVVASASNHHS